MRDRASFNLCLGIMKCKFFNSFLIIYFLAYTALAGNNRLHPWIKMN